MNILVIGSGGREHTLCWKLVQSPKCKNLYVSPGNAGTSKIATNLGISVIDFESIKEAVIKYKIEMVVVGPEAPLVEGIKEFFESDDQLEKVSLIGPDSKAAKLEGSKSFAKAFMNRHNIPTAKHSEFTLATIDKAFNFLETMSPPYVLKADGLAAGKGVLIINNIYEAKLELKSMLINKKFGQASEKVVIEEFLDGIELSCFILTDGETGITLPFAKDYKKIGEGDKGLNTGGMGAISPVPFANEEFIKKINDRIIEPTLLGLKKDQLPFQGFIFIGLINVGGEPKVIEYNVRMGDPETEVVIPRIKNDLISLFEATANKTLNKIKLEIDSRSASTVMAVSGGYPKAYEKGHFIEGINNVKNALVFHSGTSLEDNKILTAGGRVITVTGLGKDMSSALKKSYEGLEKINYKGMYYRKDIGFDL
ncbi:MAG: phosphoribosylamine--glycine ligase [Flavobacteriaceae bacterium]|nr:phosphoribosylamine--glycine ligase [Flavobacteriaceae bacterium]